MSLMKKTPLRKKGKAKISVIQRKIWELCKQIIRKRYGNVCYTCFATGLSGSNWHTGHLWAKASLGANLKYDLRVLRPQCYNCNINRGGMGADFYRRMLEENGEQYMQTLVQERQKIVNSYSHYLKIYDEYQTVIRDMDSL